MKHMVGILLFCLLSGCISPTKFRGTPNEARVTIGGEEALVSVYKPNEPLHIEPLYESRADMDKYTWLKPLLFNLNGYALHIPKADWPAYAEGEWTPERYADLERQISRMKQSYLEHPEIFGNGAMYYELRDVVVCKLNGNTYLECDLTVKKMNGARFGYLGKTLKLIDGKWVNPSEFRLDGKMSKYSKEARRMVEMEELTAQPISQLE